ncbi:MAG: peptidylprolyl isomerase [Candidatus Solibacter sp.]
MKLVLFLLAACCASAQNRPDGLYAIFRTSFGEFTARLFEKETPNTVSNFVSLAIGATATRSPETGQLVKRNFYDNITFHRVVRDEMIQAGDPTGTGRFNCGFRIRDEFLPGLTFDSSGKLAMANTGEPDSGACQFFITVGPMRTWNGKYAIFGTVIEGQEVVNAINRAPARGDKPVDPVKLQSVIVQRVGPPPVKKPKK